MILFNTLSPPQLANLSDAIDEFHTHPANSFSIMHPSIPNIPCLCDSSEFLNAFHEYWSAGKLSPILNVKYPHSTRFWDGCDEKSWMTFTRHVHVNRGAGAGSLCVPSNVYKRFSSPVENYFLCSSSSYWLTHCNISSSGEALSVSNEIFLPCLLVYWF